MDQYCSVCGIAGHNSRKHASKERNKCRFCGRRGHKAPTSKRKVALPQKERRIEVPPGFSMRRGTTSALLQEEVDIAARVLIGCQHNGATAQGIIERACTLTGISRRSMSIIRDQIVEGKVPQATIDTRGQYLRISTHRELLPRINDTIEKLHQNGVMTTTRKVCAGLDCYHGIKISRFSLARVLHQIGYSYRSPGPENTILAKETEAMRTLRLQYLQEVKQHRADGMVVVYIDESYVNQRHQSKMAWIKKGSKVYVPSGKGPRYIMYGAGSCHGWVSYPTVFRHNDSSTDYHTGMNAKHFEELFEETCAMAQEKLGRCTLLMDNAAYHKRLVDERHRLTYWNKLPAEEVKKAWSLGKVPGQEMHFGQPPEYKKDVIAFLREHPPTGETSVSLIARKHGHKVLLLPPYRPELNAIETAWAVSKNYVARHNQPGVTFANLAGIIEKGLREVGLPTWCKLNMKVEKEEDKQMAVLMAEEKRRAEFRRQHPDLIFSVRNTESDSSSSSEGESGGEEEDAEAVNVEDGLPIEGKMILMQEEQEAAMALLALGSVILEE